MILLLLLTFAVASCGKQKTATKKNAKETATEFMQRMTEGDVEGAKALATKESGPVLDKMAAAEEMPLGAEFTVESVSQGDSTAEAMVVIAGELQSLRLIEMPDGSWLVSYVAAAPVEIHADSSAAVNEEVQAEGENGTQPEEAVKTENE